MTRSLLMLATAAVLAAAPLVLAQTAPPPQSVPQAAPSGGATDLNTTRTTKGGGPLAACRADADALCAGAEGGRRARLDCLARNKDKVSAACRTAMDDLLARHASGDPGQTGGRGERTGQGPLAACEVDLATHCASGKGDGGNRRRCLVENAAKLSPECKAALEQAGGQGKQIREACAADRQSLCANAERGRDTIVCLKQNAAKLSATCSLALSQSAGRGRAQ